MSFYQSFQLAIKNILSSKIRSLLTMLGIIIGVSAVIIIVGLGNGMGNYMTEQFRSMGTNLLTVSIMGTGSSKNFDADDAYSLVEDNPDYLVNVSPTVNVAGKVKVGTETLKSTTILGVSEAYCDMKMYTVESGRFLKYPDIYKRTRVCSVGSYISKEWYDGNALGQTIKINGNTFTIVGVMDEESESEKGGTDDIVYISYTTANRLFSSDMSSYVFEVASEDTVATSKSTVEKALYEIYATNDAYNVISMSEILDMANTQLTILMAILTAIAAISLVVGGIGIMNIMLVSVSERTREIGIRKALGAKQRYIMRQFVIEAATTSALGGALGIAFGYLMSSIASIIIKNALDTNMQVTPAISSVIEAFVISAGIGILFGYLPAKKAARLNPIDALRYE